MHPRSLFRLLLVACWACVRLAGAEVSRHGVIAAEHELAANAGIAMLREGGNAVDAAVAAEFVMGVVHPSSCGIGGGGFLLVYDSHRHDPQVFDFREAAPRASRPELYVHDGIIDSHLTVRGALAVGVPGEVKGLIQALDQLGHLSLERVMEPAIRHAAEGVPVDAHLAKMLREHAVEIRQFPELAAVYLKSNGEPYEAGEILVQQDLAETLRLISDRGAEGFYGGVVGEKIVAALSTQGGVLTFDDLRDYAVRTRKPLVTPYRGFTIVGVPPPSSGGGVILEALNLLAGDDLRSLGPATPTTLHLVAEAEKLAFADRARFYGDPDFTKIPMTRLLSAEHARDLRRQISAIKPLEVQAEHLAQWTGGTSHLSVLDESGTAVALTSTINTAFGSMVLVPGTGILLNDQMDDFSVAPGQANVYGLVGTEANVLGPGRRPLSSMSPTLVLRDRVPVLALGASGGPRIISATLQVILDVIDFGMDLQHAVTAPRIHHQWVPDQLLVEPSVNPLAVSALRRIGHDVQEAADIGAVQAVQRVPGGFVGIADPRKGGAAVGW